MNNTNNALETLVQRDKQIKKANDKLKAELETTTNALSNHASNTEIHTSKEELIKFIVDHLESLDLGITKEVVSVLPTENISDNTLYFVPNEKGYHNEYLYINDKWELVGSTETNFTDYYTKLETNTLLEGKANSVHNHVVKDITDFPTIPTKVSELSNDSNFVTSTELHDYATKNDLNSKQDALSEEQLSNIDSIPDKANKSDLSTVATSGSYKDLLDKPVIPEGADLSDYYNKGETDNLLNSKANTSDLAVVAKSGNYNDLSNTPTIPTKVSDLTNDSGYITGVAWGDITSKPSFSYIAISGSYNDLVDTPTIPTKTSELTNDSGYITSVSWEDVTSKPELSQVAISGSYSDLNNTPTIPTRTSQLINDSGFLTSSSGVITSVSWSDITNKPNFSTVATSGSYNDLSNKPTIPKVYNKTLTIQKNGTNVATFTSNSNTNVTADITVPTKVSELSNDSGFITGISWDKVTNKPTLATVATSGSYTDLSNTPTIPTKVSQLENDMGFGTGGDTSNCVHKSGDETIDGAKTFTQGIKIKNSDIDLTATPTSNKYSQNFFIDKNNKLLGVVQYAQRSTDVNDLDLYVYDKNSTAHGVQITTNNELLPIGNNYSLGSSSGNKWVNVYATTFNGNLKGNADTSTSATKSSYLDSYSLPGGNKIYLDWSQQVKGYVGLKVDNTVMGGLITTDNLGSQNVVHKSGDETIAGNKTFSDRISFPSGYYMIRDANDNGLKIIRDGSNHGNNFKIVIRGDNGKILAPNGFQGNLQGNADTATSANDPNAVHKTGNEAISGAKIFLNDIFRKNTSADLTVTPTGYTNTNIIFADKNDKTLAYIEYVQRPSGVNDVGIFAHDKNGNAHGIHINTNNEVIPLMSSRESYSLGSVTYKWANVYATTFNGNSVLCTTGNAFMAQNGGYTFLIRNDGSNTYFLMSDKDGVPGTWSTARPLIISNDTGVCSINGNANSAYYSDTPATTDNSTRIATTEWVRNYVNSVGGSGGNTLGSSISAYWSTSSKVTSTQQDSNNRNYPECYSNYINRTPGVGIIYSGAQLYSELNAYANATRELGGSVQNRTYITKVTAQATFSNPISPTGKYLCTTANTVSFRAYAPEGKSAASVIDYSATKSIFIRVE